MSGRIWTETEDRCMREFYPHLTAADMASVLKRSERSVYQRAKALALHKSAEFLASDRSGRIERGRKDPRMVGTQFRSGLTPWNKGVKGSTGLHEACRRTQFKKGAMSGAARRNYKPIGSLRISKDGYLERKVTDDHPVPARRWTAEHRLVWERAHGAIPAGHAVVFRPGRFTTNPDAITEDGLELVTRAELMRRNTIHNYPPELARLVQLKGAITRQVNRIAGKAQEHA